MRVFWMLLMVSCSGAASRPDNSFPMITTAGLLQETSSSGDFSETFARESSSSTPTSSSTGSFWSSTSSTPEDQGSSTSGGEGSSSSEAEPGSSTSGTSSSTSSSEGGSTSEEEQPLEGLYQPCLQKGDCPKEAPLCLIVYDDDMFPIDGSCTDLCVEDAMCEQGICFDLTPTDKICGIPCSKDPDCPGGMDCYQFVDVGFYCI